MNPTRLLMISNQIGPDWYASFSETFTEMVDAGELEAFHQVFPRITATNLGHAKSLEELLRVGEDFQPSVALVASPKGFGHEPGWVTRFLDRSGGPTVVYYEGDPWDGRAKAINASMVAWLTAADIVFSVAREPHFSLFQKYGARDVRYIPHTYCSVTFRKAEDTLPDRARVPEYDVVMIGSRLARWGRVSRMPGAVQRAKLVRSLQQKSDLRLAVYGKGWSGRGVRGSLTYGSQPSAIREGLMSVNWDHFPRHESYASDRLPISLLAGRAHVTTAHPRMEWLPGEEIGLFQEPSPSAILEQVERLRASDADEVIELGSAGHRWVRNRLSHRQAARFMLGAVDDGFLRTLPEEPWGRLIEEWPH